MTNEKPSFQAFRLSPSIFRPSYSALRLPSIVLRPSSALL